ncbi:MAG: hypothetical protein U5K76_09815 [Woeseiaceae bacterium]|nr:hypothetical protein [Woeseiaceae bacterium]
MLDRLQEQLTAIYQVDTDYRIDDFLITDPAVARVLGRESILPDTDETVLLVQDDESVSLSVYLDEHMLARLAAQDPLTNLLPDQLSDLWTVIEGISHFTYLVWCAQQDKPVTLLELELQAEVDKFVSTWLLALRQEDTELAARLHGWLFDEVSFHPALEGDERERYRAANDYAARFCHRLRDRLPADGDSGGLQELRHFYRLTQGRKISHIHSQAWLKN